MVEAMEDRGATAAAYRDARRGARNDVGPPIQTLSGLAAGVQALLLDMELMLEQAVSGRDPPAPRVRGTVPRDDRRLRADSRRTGRRPRLRWSRRP